MLGFVFLRVWDLEEEILFMELMGKVIVVDVGFKFYKEFRRINGLVGF